MTAPEPLSPEQLAEYRALAEQIAADPWVLSDCEGWLKIWRESALTHIVRDESGEIDGFSEPSSHRVTDLVVEIELDSWDPGEDETDDEIRTNVGALFTAREALPALLAEVARLAARVARLEQSEAAGQRVIARMSREARGLEDELVRRQRRITDLADRTETAETRVAEYQALELGDLDGRVSASCPNPSHPTWLREADDIRACPWCRIAELEQVTQPQTTARGLTSREAAFRLLGSAVADPKLAAAYIKAADEEREATIAARAEQAGGDR